MSTMTLTLNLKGISQLIQSIQALNKALNTLNTTLGNVAKNIKYVADQVTRMSSAMKTIGGKSTPPKFGGTSKNSGGGGGGGGSGGNVPFDDRTFGSLLFSLFSGNFRVLLAKVFSHLTVNLTKGGANAGIFGQLFSGVLKLAGQFILLAAAIALEIEAIKKLTEWINSVGKTQSNLWYAGNGNKKLYGQLRGLGGLAGLSNEEVADAVRGEAGGAPALINKIKHLRDPNMDDAAAERFARLNNISQFLPIRDASKWRFDQAINKQDELSPEKRTSISDFNAAIGDVKDSFANLALLLTPFLRVISYAITGFARFIDAVTGITFALTLLGQIIEVLLPGSGRKNSSTKEDKQAKATEKFSQAVDKFTSAVGTHGAGERGNNAIPRAWSWYGNQQQLINMSDNLGAFQF